MGSNPVVCGDVKRLWLLRQSLLLQDFGANKSMELKDMLEQCVVSPVFLKSVEGRRFLSFIFGMNPSFIEQLHRAIKTQLPSCTKTMVQNYAEIYFRAWRTSSGPYLEKIEIHCLQDYMDHAVHAVRSGPKPLASLLRQFLSYIHKQRLIHHNTDEMLQRLYEPILWRALKCANGFVRANAASILIDAFPLQRPDAPIEENDALMQKQFDTLDNLLEDPTPLVRSIGVNGICKIASFFWELIPSQTLQTLLMKLVRDMVYDSASSDVRAAVFNGLAIVLDNPLSHEYMKALLPSLKNCIHDVTEKVRLAVADLLLKIKGIRAIKFWNVVPMDQIIVRIELDSPCIVRRLVKLVFSSFMPLEKEVQIQASRCIALLNMNQLAARVFYQNSTKHMPIAATVKIMCYLGQTVLMWMKEKADKNTSNADDEEDDDKENAGGLSEDISLEIIEGMLETVAILWTVIHYELQKHEDLEKKLVKRFSHIMPICMGNLESNRAVNSLIFLSGYLPPSSIPYFTGSVLSKLKGLSGDAKEEYFGVMLDSLCKWGRISSLFELITDWLNAGLTIPDESLATPSASKTKRKTKKSVKFKEPVEPQPELALRFLTRILCQKTSRSIVLESGTTQLKEVNDILKNVQKCIEFRLKNNGELSDVTSDQFLINAWCSYCKLQIHVCTQDQDIDKLMKVFNNLLTWTDVELIPVVAKKIQNTEETVKETNKNKSKRGKRKEEKKENNVTEFALKLIQMQITIASEMVIIGFGNDDFYHHLGDLTTSLLLTDHAGCFLVSLTRLLYQMTQQCNTIEKYVEESVLSEAASVMVGKIVKSLMKCSHKQKETETDVPELLRQVAPGLSEILRCCQRYQKLNPQLSQHIMAPIMTAVLTDVMDALRKESDIEPAESVTELPILAAFFLGIINKTKPLTSDFVEELYQCVKSGALCNLQQYLAVLHILYTLSKGRHKVSYVKDCLLVSQQDLENMILPEAENTDDEEPSLERKIHTCALKLARETLESIGVVA
uniref:Condensin-2 complex subunit G2-like n=1 Tax=Saccoglossus kowalevskii TaxID=10224 RepID=A0ABM0MDW2_SACKO|nr:PREDICTED: condensin-2 complex subunit G2-like [Saccoglossus kowalevskii]